MGLIPDGNGICRKGKKKKKKNPKIIIVQVGLGE
jgi:hypothetical protein